MLGELDEWRDGLSRVGIQLGNSGSPPDLVVAPASHARDALASPADMLILEGRVSLADFRSAGYAARRFGPVPSLDQPRLLLPLDQPVPARYAIRRWPGPTRRWTQVRNRAAEILVGRGAFPGRSPVIVAARTPAPPFVVSAAARLGVPPDSEWFVSLGSHPLSRCAFHLFPPGQSEPAFVLKFGRLPDSNYRFDREAAAYERARYAGGVVLAHAPRQLGRVEVDGVSASLETAGVGERLATFLIAPGGRKRKLQTIEQVAAWLVEVASQTCSPTRPPREELSYFAERVLPSWEPRGAPADLVSRVAAVPAVFKHGDVYPENIIVGPDGFTVVDWEDSEADGFPLFDLASFLSEALARRDGAMSPDARERHFVSLFRGELPASATLFAWTRAAIDASHVPADAVGPVVTLFWLHLAYAARDFADRAQVLANRPAAGPLLYERWARLWLSDPALGPTWDRWRM